MQLSSNPMTEQCQWLSVGIFLQYQAGHERKDSGERECKQATLPLRKTVWGNPQDLGGIKIPQLACLPSPWQSRHYYPCVEACMYCMRRVELASTGNGGRFVSLPRRCIHAHDRFPLQPQHWNSARPRLTCLVARHSGPCRRRMQVNERDEFSLHRGISRPVCRLVLGFCIMIGDAMSGCHVDRRRLAVLACM